MALKKVTVEHANETKVAAAEMIGEVLTLTSQFADLYVAGI